MDEREVREMMGDISAVMKSLVSNALAPIVARLDALDRRFVELPVPKDGNDADPEKVAGIVAERMLPQMKDLRAAIEALPPAPELPDIAGMIAEATAASEGRVLMQTNQMIDVRVALEVAALPASASPEAVAAIEAAMQEDRATFAERVRSLVPEPPAPAELPDIPAMIAEAVAALPPAQAGKDADPEQTAALVADTVARAVAALPKPENGKSITVEDLRPLVDEAVAKAAAAIPVPKDGKDGVNLAGALIDRDGNLVLTLSNGTTAPLGRVEGKDGTDVDMAAVERSIVEKVAAIPKPKDGLDGVGFDDMDLVETDKGVVLRFTRGEVVKDFRLPIVVDRGVWKEGTFRKGDGVTWGGSFWIAQDETTDKPDSGKGWRLAVKKGRDGKDGQMKPAPEHKPVKVG